ncbi:MAG: hypothetical protein CMJ08_01015 [Pelagibacterales bacterium]|nr:hypothetical protein [Pelagibacterales bacterium]|tara:strand:- start:8894 stop:9859 length:966 start_codon:yes stop_codon:yes gene_type:complete
MKILITGAAGFIGSKLAENLLDAGYDVFGIDNLNDYYDVKLKFYRLHYLKKHKKFQFYKIDISNTLKLKNFFKKKKIDIICHLAAQAGVRYSLINPRVYAKSNINGFLEILEYCRFNPKTKLVYASSSSVYGGNKKIPFSVTDDVSHPVSLYAATKRANELMAESYSKLFSLKIIGLRFFTVYGPWGRPDMAIWQFTDAIIKNKPINIFHKGILKRDFTYIDDIIKGIRASLFFNNNSKNSYHKLYNLGNNKPESVNKIVTILEKLLNKKAKKKFLPMQLGDVKNTFADINQSKKHLGFNPNTNIDKGLESFIAWFKNYKK